MSGTTYKQGRLGREAIAGAAASAGRPRAEPRPPFIPRRPWRLLLNRNMALIVDADGIQVRMSREVCEMILRAVNGPEPEEQER